TVGMGDAGIKSALAGGAMSKLFGGGQKAASGGIQGDVLATDNNTVGMRSEERFSRNAETDLVCRLLLAKQNQPTTIDPPSLLHKPLWCAHPICCLLMLPLAPSSSLFPYTTLFRSIL